VKDVTPNIPEVVEEVRALFEGYEQALIDKNVDVLDATFWNSPHTIRYALNENGYGFRSDPRPSRRPADRARHQGKAPALEIRHGGPRYCHGKSRVKVHGHDLIGRQARPGCAFPMPAGK